MERGEKEMNRKKLAAICGITMLAMSTAFAAQAEETEMTTEAAVETAAEEEAEVVEEIVLQFEDAEPVKITNTAKLNITGVSVEAAEEGLVNVTMMAADGTVYEFLNVKPADMQNPELVLDGVFAYVKYIGIESGKERKYGQTGEIQYEEAVELFAVDDVYMRAAADSEAEIVGVINRGDAIEVLGETASHYMVKKDDVTGYSARSCISEDEQDAIAAVQAEEYARAEIARQAAEAAQRAASKSSGKKTSGKKEVKRQKFDDCDGSGHGYYLITYSDGSTGIIEY